MVPMVRFDHGDMVYIMPFKITYTYSGNTERAELG